MAVPGVCRFVLCHDTGERMRYVRGFQRGDFFGRELQLSRFDCAVHVVKLCCADNRGCDLCQQPGEGNLRHGDAALAGDFVHTVNDEAVLLCRSVILESGVGILLQALCGFSGLSGESAGCQGAVGRQGNAFLLAVWPKLARFYTSSIALL